MDQLADCAVDSVVFDSSHVRFCCCLVLLLLVTLRMRKCKTQSLAMMKKYLRWKAEWLCGIPHGSINWAFVAGLSFQNWPGLSCLLMCVFCAFWICFWAARSCSDVWLSFRSYGGTGTTDDNTWKQPRWNKECGLEWFDYLIACASTSKRVNFSDVCSVTLFLFISVVQPLTREIAQFLFALLVKHAQSGYKVALGIHGDMQRSCLLDIVGPLDDGVCAFPRPCVLCWCVCRRKQHRMTTQESNHCLMPVWR